jgi:hypothetical protein
VIKISEDILAILNKSLDLVGKRDLPAEQLEEFIKNTLQHEVKEITIRKKMFEDEEFENEIEINNFPFYTDGYRVGVFIELSGDNIFIFRDKEGNEIQVMQLFKKDKDGEFIFDKNGEKITTGRCLMRLKARRGFMSIFIGLNKVEAMDEENYYVLVGGLTTQWKVANSEDEYHKKKETGVEYTDFPSFTLNVWQIGKITKTKSGKLKIILPECNWKEEEEKK